MNQQQLEQLEKYEKDFNHAITENVTKDVAYYRTLLSNIIMIGAPNEDWVLIDTSLKRYHERIIHACETRYGTKAPKAIILTHGHFDHAGSAKKLVDYWNVPIFIHEKEIDYVTGKQSYPPGDPTVGGGFISLLSAIFPTKPEHLEKIIQPLPVNGEVPFLSDWKYIETPGHTKGHISLYRKKDGLLIAGDAISTEKAESSWSVIFPLQHVYGPPAYFTEDWHLAEESVQKLAQLQPKMIIAGHGLPMEGTVMQEELDQLASNFMKLAIPKHKKGH